MKRSGFCFLLFCFFLLLHFTSGADSTSSAQPSTVSKKTTTTTTKPTTTTTTPTTTSLSTTTSEPTTTTKPTTTTAPTTTTPAPTPTPSWPQPKVFNVTENNNTCIIFKASIRMTVNITNPKSNQSEITTLYVPADSKVSGRCGKNMTTVLKEWITFEFSNSSLEIDFTRNISKTSNVAAEKITAGTYGISGVNLKLQIKGKQLNFKTNLTYFVNSLSKSWKCVTEQNIKLNGTEKGATAVLAFKDLQMEPFRTSTDSVFSEAVDCEQDKTNDIVPIAVGCALAALVIIVLIAYVIGRRRSRARGYQSV